MADPRLDHPLGREVRKAARFALYASLTGVLALLAVGMFSLRVLRPTEDVDRSWVDTDFNTEQVNLLQKYLQINTSQPNADEISGARFLASVLEAEGIPAHIEYLGERHANVWAILEGKNPEALILHSHIDTDPVTDLKDWVHPPFSGEIERPYIYGRGAYDMKSIAVAELATMLALKRSGKPLSRSVIFLATGTEEVGSDLGTRWVLAQHPEIGKRAWGFLTEGGVVETRAANEVKYWGIEFVQKHFVDVTVCGPSQEQLEGLRTELLEERDQLSPETSFQATSTPELEAFLTHYGPTRDSERLRAILARPRQLHLDGVAYSELPPYLRAFFRDEAIPFPVKEIAAGDYSMLIKMHLLPGADTEEVLARLLPPWKRAGLSVAVHDEHSADHGSPLDHPIYRSLEEELQKAFPDRPVGPQFLPYTATDSRWVRAAGIPAYGFSPFLVFSSETFRIGLPNERISLPAFLKGCEIYLRAVQQLVG